MNLLPRAAIVFVKDCFGIANIFETYWDFSSEVNLITQETVSRLRMKQNKSNVNISDVLELRTHLKYIVTATIKSRDSIFESITCFSAIKSISSHHLIVI